MELEIVNSPETHTTTYMTGKENRHIGEIIKVGRMSLQVKCVTYNAQYQFVDIDVYEAWGRPGSHAPMTTCGHNLVLRKRVDEGNEWYFVGNEYLNDNVVDGAGDLLDTIVGEGALVVYGGVYGGVGVLTPRRLAKRK